MGMMRGKTGGRGRPRLLGFQAFLLFCYLRLLSCKLSHRSGPKTTVHSTNLILSSFCLGHILKTLSLRPPSRRRAWV